ncbi:myb domain protein 25 [Actinidia rufa]|uniref:Myb domain protein 25 n=1 Tax=Actinidia rufa TaxID=165716 RepID=A0A7J0E8Z8_9ERIC|nr:myb domain protein 25 [Actinidia rufa]
MRTKPIHRSSQQTAVSGGDAVLESVGNDGGSRVRGPWSPEEDAILSRLVSEFGARNWNAIARAIPGRSGKSCRLRWINQLDPCVKHKPFTGNLRHSRFNLVFAVLNFKFYVCVF